MRAPRTITVTGTGKVEATPDVADLNLGVSATSKSARAARAAADAQLRRVLAALKARGVAPADIQTSQVSLSPNFSRNGSTVVGYTATNSVTAKHPRARHGRRGRHGSRAPRARTTSAGRC